MIARHDGRGKPRIVPVLLKTRIPLARPTDCDFGALGAEKQVSFSEEDIAFWRADSQGYLDCGRHVVSLRNRGEATGGGGKVPSSSNRGVAMALRDPKRPDGGWKRRVGKDERVFAADGSAARLRALAACT